MNVAVTTTGQRSESRYFNGDAFKPAAEARSGPAPRLMVRNPGLWDVDTAFSKKFMVTGSKYLEFRADRYNFCNHPNRASMDTTIRDVTNPSIGTPGTLSPFIRSEVQ
ncbi:MAG: hypothetical protein NTY38_15440 [Acidobacteria bacterium]|nr:hypothetical protein [Acidobacteriota bacterium]